MDNFKRKLNRTNLLWQFILELLIDENNYKNVITWTNCVLWEFEIHDIEKLVSLWQEKKNLRKMNQSNIYRSMYLYCTTFLFNGKYIWSKTNNRNRFRFTDDIIELITIHKKWCISFTEKVNNLIV